MVLHHKEIPEPICVPIPINVFVGNNNQCFASAATIPTKTLKQTAQPACPRWLSTPITPAILQEGIATLVYVNAFLILVNVYNVMTLEGRFKPDANNVMGLSIVMGSV